MPDLHIVILAAGKGTRMKSLRPKVLHRVAGLPMIEYVLRASRRLAPRTCTLVVGHGADAVREALRGIEGLQFATQEPQLGTGHALLQAEPLLRGAAGTVLLLSGDVPLLGHETLARFLEAHEASRAAATVMTAVVVCPRGYGRVVRAGGALDRIVEERDASPAERRISEINGGVYAFAVAPLFDALRTLPSANAQGEYYLPDLIGVYRRQGLGVEAVALELADEIRGINSRAELAEASRLVRQTKNEALMAAGVTIEDPATTYIEPDVSVGADTVIHPGVHLEGRTRIGGACEIHAGVRIVDSILEDRVTVHNFCVLRGAHVRSGASVGPFAHLRPETELERRIAGRQFRRAEEDRARRGLEGEPSDLPGRRDDRRSGERRRRDDHVQLRRRAQEPDDHRGRRVHRERCAAGRAGPGRARGLRGRGVHDHERRPGGRARHRARPAAQHRGLGRPQEGPVIIRVRHHRLHRLEPGRPGPARRPAAA